MTFPLGSLGIDGTDAAGALRPPQSVPGPSWQTQLGLLVAAVAWLIAVIALATHNGADTGFTTSGAGGPVLNKAGVAGAWFSDLAYFLVGYSAWWAVLVGARLWLGGLARVLRARHGESSHAEPPRRWPVWLGLALLLASSASLEWTRLYQHESVIAGGNAGGVLGYGLGTASQALLGFAGSGVLWIAVLVAGISLGLGFSWLGAAERIGMAIDSLRLRRSSRIEREEDA
ncbi:MAG: DNA translocase FtsK 4TM domain-containing protein, partial [Pseudomonadota bacterium]|nr:DNA translocase FtsK 4TM domain-containing protein [Pseudomonadota bacterium]